MSLVISAQTVLTGLLTSQTPRLPLAEPLIHLSGQAESMRATHVRMKELISALALSLASCGTLGRLPSPYGPIFPHLLQQRCPLPIQ